MGRVGNIRVVLADAAENDLGDWFEYAVGEPMMDLDGPPNGGAWYPVECLLDGRDFARFHIDAAVGDRDSGTPQ